MLHTMYLCPLARGGTFSLSKLGMQRNCNATDTEAFTCDEGLSYPRSYRTQQQLRLASSSAGGTTGPGAPTRCGGDSGTYKHVEFAGSTSAGGTDVPLSSRPSQHQQQQRVVSSSCSVSASAGGRSGGGQSSARRTMTAEEKHMRVCSMLVPLVSNNQSNLHRLSGGLSTNNTQEQSPTTSGDRDAGNGCDAGTAKGSRGGNQLGTCGVPYWNIYEYQDFRELQHGNGHVFDAQTDPYLHREGIILDNYNRLQKSYPKFRMPKPIYHLR